MTERCQLCHAPLRLVYEHASRDPGSTAEHRHYRCDYPRCPADAGQLVIGEGRVRRLGPACDPAFESGALDERARQLMTGGDVHARAD